MKLRSRIVWNESLVEEWSAVRKQNSIVSCGRLFSIIVGKNVERHCRNLELRNPKSEFNVPVKRATQPASRLVFHAVVEEQCAVAEEAEQQSGGAGRSNGPFPADLTPGPLQRKGPERFGRGRGSA